MQYLLGSSSHDKLLKHLRGGFELRHATGCQEIDPEAQADLEASVREMNGVRVPITVVPKGDGRYQLLYGERRLRATQTSELPAVLCLVFEEPPTWMEALDTQLVENLCRAELRPLELAQGLWRRILGANIEALEEEHGDDGSTTEQLLANYFTPTSQIAALEDRLCNLAGVAAVAGYFLLYNHERRLQNQTSTIWHDHCFYRQ